MDSDSGMDGGDMCMQEKKLMKVILNGHGKS